MQLHNMHPLYLTLPCQQQPAPHPFETHPRHNKDQCGQICSTCRCIWHNRDWWRCCYHRCYRGNHRRLHTHQLWRNFRQGWGSWRAGAQHGTKDVPCFLVLLDAPMTTGRTWAAEKWDKIRDFGDSSRDLFWDGDSSRDP